MKYKVQLYSSDLFLNYAKKKPVAVFIRASDYI